MAGKSPALDDSTASPIITAKRPHVQSALARTVLTRHQEGKPEMSLSTSKRRDRAAISLCSLRQVPCITKYAFHTLTAAALLSLGGTTAHAQKTISVNFSGYLYYLNSGVQLSPGDVAGVVPKSNWNNTGDNSGSLSGLKDETGAMTTASLTWTSSGQWGFGASGGSNGNNSLMSGYLDQYNAGDSSVATVTGLPAAPFGYNIYVYCDGDGTNGRVGTYTIGSVSKTLTDNANFSGTFTPGPTGNYLVFPNVTGTGFTLTATATAGSPPRAPLNGFQIVPATTSMPKSPAAPTGLAAVGGEGSITLTWNAVPNADGYNVLRSTSAAGPFASVGAVSAPSTTFKDSPLAPNIRYYYAITAVGLGLTSGNSNVASAIALVPQQRISGFVATATSGNAAPVANNSGLYAVSTSGTALTAVNDANSDYGDLWTSDNIGGFGSDSKPTLFIDLGQVCTLKRFHLWNYNLNQSFGDITGRGFKDVVISTSQTGNQSINFRVYDDAVDVVGPNADGSFTFAKAPGTNNYLGEDYVFPTPVTTRYISLRVLDNWSGGFAYFSGINKIHFFGTPVTPLTSIDPSTIAVMATSTQVGDPSPILSNSGLTETYPGSGSFTLATNAPFWNGGYNNGTGDINPTVFFDLGSVKNLGGLRVWNYNPGGYYNFRGMRGATISTSATGTLSTDGTTYADAVNLSGPNSDGTFQFAKALGMDYYEGEYYPFSAPVTTRYISLRGYGNFGGFDPTGLGRVRFYQATANVTGQIALEGVSDLTLINPAVPLGTFHFEFRIPGTSTVVKTADATLTPVGAGSGFGFYTLTGIPLGNFDVTIKGSKSLRVAIHGAAISSPTNLPDVTLQAGDASGDNTVDIGDFGILVNAYGGDTTITGSGYDSRTDFDYNGVVDIGDFGILVNEYGNSGAP